MALKKLVMNFTRFQIKYSALHPSFYSSLKIYEGLVEIQNMLVSPRDCKDKMPWENSSGEQRGENKGIKNWKTQP